MESLPVSTAQAESSTAVPPRVAEEDSSDLDLEATIAEFVRDETRTSLELPRSLSADQRKVARRLADQHPELKCESYGFGTERQLHLFKKDVGRVGASAGIGVIGQERPPNGAQNAVRVKNTFIDDWVGGDGEGDKDAEPFLCRSMPAAPLIGSSLQQCLREGRMDLAPVVESSTRPVTTEEPTSVGAASPGSSTTAGVPDSSPTAIGSSAASSAELPSLPEGIKVSTRNTFIHIDSSQPVNERIVQSMPDGMFRQHLQAESAVRQAEASDTAEVAAVASSLPAATAETAPMDAPASLLQGASMSASTVPPAPAYEPIVNVGAGDPATAFPAPPSRIAPVPTMPPPDEPATGQLIALGTEVIIEGLVKLPDFNGLSGIVQSLDAESGRYDVHLHDPAGARGWRKVKVKADNLKLKLPPPPRNAPALILEECILPEEVAGTGGGGVPPTPKWEEDFQGNDALPAAKPQLNLNALV